MIEVITDPKIVFDDNFADAAFEDYKKIGESLGRDQVVNIGMALTKLKLLEGQGSKVTGEDPDIVSHSEYDIFKGCISMMREVYKDFLNYLDYIGVDLSEMDEEELPRMTYTNFEIVQRLFLHNTDHSGGASTRKKCRSLKIDSADGIEFNPFQSEK